MTREEFKDALRRAPSYPTARLRYLKWRQAKSARQRFLNELRRQSDPQWWHDYLERNARYRRERAANDDEYRARRNRQAK